MIQITIDAMNIEWITNESSAQGGRKLNFAHGNKDQWI